MIATALTAFLPAVRQSCWAGNCSMPAGKMVDQDRFDGNGILHPPGFVKGGILSAMLDDTMGPAVFVMTDGRPLHRDHHHDR